MITFMKKTKTYIHSENAYNISEGYKKCKDSSCLWSKKLVVRGPGMGWKNSVNHHISFDFVYMHVYPAQKKRNKTSVCWNAYNFVN